MARPLRIEFPGAFYHITSRGDRKEDIFLSDVDRHFFLEVYSKVAERFGWICYAYCLMPNHYHLVIETPLPNLSRGMAQLNGVYTQKFNWINQKVGHLFQGRYKSILIEKEAYLLELLRYVVLNPVRASIVQNPSDWPWSSYQATAGIVESPVWLDTTWTLECFFKNPKRARSEYISFIDQGNKWGEDIWENLKKQIYLGSDEFIEEVQEYSNTEKDMSEIPKEQAQPVNEDLSYYRYHFSSIREGMARAYLEGRYAMKEISNEFKVHTSTVSRAVKDYENKSPE